MLVKVLQYEWYMYTLVFQAPQIFACTLIKMILKKFCALLVVKSTTLLYLKWITNKVLLHSTGNSAQRYAAAWTGEEFGGEWTHVHV